MDFASIATATSSIKAAVDIAKTLVEVKSFADFETMASELRERIVAAQVATLEAQSEQSAMIQRISDLEKEIARLETWSAERQRYELINLWNSGVVAYGLKKSMSNSEPPHYICTNCYDDGRKSILQPQKRNGGRLMLLCPRCKSEFHSNYSRDLPIQYV